MQAWVEYLQNEDTNGHNLQSARSFGHCLFKFYIIPDTIHVS